MNEFLDPKHRAEVTIGCAAIALHALASNERYADVEPALVVKGAFALAAEFLRQAEELKT